MTKECRSPNAEGRNDRLAGAVPDDGMRIGARNVFHRTYPFFRLREHPGYHRERSERTDPWIFVEQHCGVKKIRRAFGVGVRQLFPAGPGSLFAKTKRKAYHTGRGRFVIGHSFVIGEAGDPDAPGSQRVATFGLYAPLGHTGWHHLPARSWHETRPWLSRPPRWLPP